MQLADLGAISSSASFSSIGWGALDQKVNERAKEENIAYDVAANLELGKFFPANWGIRLPFYGQYAQTIINPEFDAYDLDITVEDELQLRTAAELPEVKERSQTSNTIKTFNLTNVRKERVNARPNQPARQARGAAANAAGGTGTVGDGSGRKKKVRKPHPLSIENFSASYSYTETDFRDPIIESDRSVDQTLGLDYNYSRRGGYIEPFKKVKSKHLKLLKEFNFNPLPNSLGFNSSLNRFFSSRRFRIPDTPVLEFDDRRFNWERRYDLNWNLTKALKINFDAFNESYIDEVRQTGIAATAAERPYIAFVDNGTGFLEKQDVTNSVNTTPDFVEDYWKDNLRSGGRNTAYDHSIGVTYKLPIRYLPYLDWVDITANYRASFGWTAGALITDSQGIPLPGLIQNSQDRSLTANLNFDKLYKKFDYVKRLDKTKRASKAKRKRGGDKVTVTNDKDGNRVSTKKKAREASVFEKLLIRPIFSLRSARITIREDFSSVVPGYTGTPDYFGLDDFDAPGVGFILGAQPNIDSDNPNNFLDRAANNAWITNSTGFNQELIQVRGQNYEAKFKIEPWKDFKVDLDFKKTHRETHSEVFKFLDVTDKEDLPAGQQRAFSDFSSLASRDFGSFDVTFYSVNTLFGRDQDALFNTFINNRTTISQRLGALEDPINQGPHEVDGAKFAKGFGKQSSRVIVPAFLAAYTDADPNLIDLDLEAQVSRRSYIPKPNWNLRYDGLSKLPWFRDRFSSFTLEHSYNNALRVTRFDSDVEFGIVDANGRLETKQNGNYFTRLEIPAIQISESFSPLIGIKLKTKKDFTFELSYEKSRDLLLKINTSSQLEETTNEGFVFGLGYTIKDSNFLKKKKGKANTRKSRTDKDKDEDEDDKGRTRNARSVTTTRGSDMTFLLNVSYTDEGLFIHEIDKQISVEDEQIRGGRTLQIGPSVDYILNENVTLRAFFDYNMNTPYGTLINSRTSAEGGITVRLTLK